MAQIETLATHNFHNLQEQPSNTSLPKRRFKSYPLSNGKEEGEKKEKEAKILVAHIRYIT